MDTYTQLKVFSNTSEAEVNQFLKDNTALSPVVITAQVVALPGRSNMLTPSLTVVVQLHHQAEAVEVPEVKTSILILSSDTYAALINEIWSLNKLAIILLINAVLLV